MDDTHFSRSLRGTCRGCAGLGACRAGCGGFAEVDNAARASRVWAEGGADGRLIPRSGSRSGVRPIPRSMASLASWSASLLPPRSGVVESRIFRVDWRDRRASSHSGRRSGLLTLYLPCICLTISSESAMTRSRGRLFSKHHRRVRRAGLRVFGVIVGAFCREEFAEPCDDAALAVFNYCPVIRLGPGLPRGPSVAVGDEHLGRRAYRGGIGRKRAGWNSLELV